ncbi:MAG: hypothetical protein FWE91_07140 [Defluviitaleaceae bacterium]|nr:hypothetical protein [Defluviitaleaceae bacterium]MCL2836571.1 hypothetical protein [Defluviitaleaceae bacterium]
MNINKIASNIRASVSGGHWTLCDKNTFGNETGYISAYLNDVFGEDTLDMRDAVFTDIHTTPEGKAVAVSGFAECRQKITFTQKNEDGETAIFVAHRLETEIPEISLPVADLYQEYGFTSGKEGISSKGGGSVQIGGCLLDLSGAYNGYRKNWEFSAATREGADFSLLGVMGAMLKPLGINFNLSLLPDIRVTDFTFIYATGSALLSPIAHLEMRTNVSLSVCEKLGLRNLGVTIGHTCGKKDESAFSFSLTGDLVIGNSKSAAVMKYERGTFNFILDTEDFTAPNIGDVASVFGLDAASWLPREFSQITLNRLEAAVAGDFSAIPYFNISFSTGEPWKFFDIDSLQLLNIGVCVTVEKSGGNTGVFALIDGTVRLFGQDIILYASVSPEREGWEFGARLPEDNDFHINAFVSEFARVLFGAEGFALPIPDILISNAMLMFRLSDKSFTAKATVKVGEPGGGILRKFFGGAQASFEVSSSVKDGKREYKVMFDGSLVISEQHFAVRYEYDRSGGTNMLRAGWENKAPISPLSLAAVIGAMGGSVPAVLNDFDLSVDKASMEYDFSNSILNITVENKKYGGVKLSVWNDGIIDCAVIITCNDIALSGLPVVGTKLKLLDSLKIQQLSFAVTTRKTKYEGWDIPPGAAIMGNISGEKVYAQLTEFRPKENEFAQDSDGISMVKWFTIEKSLSVFSFHRFGIGYDNGRLSFLLDASLQTSPISMNLMGLGVGMNINNPRDIAFRLDGLGVGYKSEAVSISGEFANMSTKEKETYAGSLMIKIKDFSLFAFGLYEATEEYSALMAYALLGLPIGGPPIFFVTGLAAGFGYNEKLPAPPIEKVAEFPLVAAATGKLNEKGMVAALLKAIQMSKGQYFLAAGVRFTSFKLINSFALLLVSLGNEPEYSLLGVSTLTVPFDKTESPIARAELLVKASYRPSAGLFAIQAQLSSDSYILSKECTLTGGFAFFTWFSGNHKGDFVLTLGGYSDTYTKPPHYPAVPRVGFRWRVSNNITISGEAYFALTPRMLMAGGKLEAVYQSGNLKAWFIAKAYFEIRWKPLWYEAGISVRLGASYRVSIFGFKKTFSLEIGASLRVWGPEFSGKVSISWFIISFTIYFGANANKPAETIDWDTFCSSFLPQDNTANAGYTACTVNVSSGQIGIIKLDDNDTPAVRPDELVITVSSCVPAAEITVNGCGPLTGSAAGILPMGASAMKSDITVLFISNRIDIVTAEYEEILDNVPAALWGNDPSSGNTLVKGALTGVRVSPKRTEADKIFPEASDINIEKLGELAKIERSYNWASAPVINNPYKQEKALDRFCMTAMDAKIIKNRDSLLESWHGEGLLSGLPGAVDITDLAKHGKNLFDADIFLGVVV